MNLVSKGEIICLNCVIQSKKDGSISCPYLLKKLKSN